MHTIAKVIPNKNLSASAKLYRPQHLVPNSIALSDPGIMVMTDLKKVVPYSINPLATIDEANNKMIICGVRLLFVTVDNDHLVGLITATDLLGERPVNYLREYGGSRESILVQDIMTRREQLEAISIEDVAASRVSDIVDTLRFARRQHVLVYETQSGGRELIRGIISRTQVERQLGMEIQRLGIANSFADLEYALVAQV